MKYSNRKQFIKVVQIYVFAIDWIYTIGVYSYLNLLFFDYPCIIINFILFIVNMVIYLSYWMVALFLN